MRNQRAFLADTARAAIGRIVATNNAGIPQTGSVFTRPGKAPSKKTSAMIVSTTGQRGSMSGEAAFAFIAVRVYAWISRASSSFLLKKIQLEENTASLLWLFRGVIHKIPRLANENGSSLA